jgi:MYXO-CTERM domain-containing protein
LRWQVLLGVATALVGTVFAAGLAAIRLLPVAETMSAAPRIVGGAPGNSYLVLVKLFFFPFRPDSDDGEFHAGALALAAALVAIAGRRRSRPLVIAIVLFGWLAAGYAVKPSLFGALHRLPLYGTLRYPERFLVLVGLAYWP